MRSDKVSGWTLIGVALLILSIMLVSAVVMYGDWRCAFAECRIDKR